MKVLQKSAKKSTTGFQTPRQKSKSKRSASKKCTGNANLTGQVKQPRHYRLGSMKPVKPYRLGTRLLNFL